MKLKECLQNINQKELKRLKNLYMGDKETPLEELEQIIIIRTIDNLLTLTDTEEDILSKKEKITQNTKEVKHLKEQGLIYKIKEEYIVPEEIFEIIKIANKEDMKSNKKALVANFYLIANGVLTTDELLKLSAKTGVNITNKELKKIIKNMHFIIEDNKICLDEIAKTFYKEEISKSLNNIITEKKSI